MRDFPHGGGNYPLENSARSHKPAWRDFLKTIALPIPFSFHPISGFPSKRHVSMPREQARLGNGTDPLESHGGGNFTDLRGTECPFKACRDTHHPSQPKGKTAFPRLKKRCLIPLSRVVCSKNLHPLPAKFRSIFLGALPLVSPHQPCFRKHMSSHGTQKFLTCDSRF